MGLMILRHATLWCYLIQLLCRMRQGRFGVAWSGGVASGLLTLRSWCRFWSNPNLVLAYGVQSVALTVVTIVVINNPQIGYSNGL